MSRRRISPGLIAAPALLVVGLLLLPAVLERWLEGAGGVEPDQPISQSELDARAVRVNAAIDAAMVRLGIDPTRALRSSAAMENKEGLVWESLYRESTLPESISVERFTREILEISDDLPERCTVDVVRPDPLRAELYATVGKARIRHELLRVSLSGEPRPEEGLHPNIALVLLPTDGPLPDPDSLGIPVTIGIRPEGSDAAELAARWTRAGHEVLTALDLEAAEDPDWHNADRLRTLLAPKLTSMPDQVGALILGDTRSARDPRRMDLLAGVLEGDRMLLVDHWRHPGSVAVQSARRGGLQAVSVDMLLEAAHGETMDAVLDGAGRLAVLKGRVVPAMVPSEERTAALIRWIPRMRARGFHFVFVHEALRDGPNNRGRSAEMLR